MASGITLFTSAAVAASTSPLCTASADCTACRSDRPARRRAGRHAGPGPAPERGRCRAGREADGSGCRGADSAASGDGAVATVLGEPGDPLRCRPAQPRRHRPPARPGPRSGSLVTVPLRPSRPSPRVSPPARPAASGTWRGPPPSAPCPPPHLRKARLLPQVTAYVRGGQLDLGSHGSEQGIDRLEAARHRFPLPPRRAWRRSARAGVTVSFTRCCPRPVISAARPIRPCTGRPVSESRTRKTRSASATAAHPHGQRRHRHPGHSGHNRTHHAAHAQQHRHHHTQNKGRARVGSVIRRRTGRGPSTGHWTRTVFSCGQGPAPT